ncbi:MAG: hypothetical protein AAF823_12400 [Planctomycetota bacterium]
MAFAALFPVAADPAPAPTPPDVDTTPDATPGSAANSGNADTDGVEPAEPVAEPASARIVVHANTLHPISPLLFGQFMEDAGVGQPTSERGPEAAVDPNTGTLSDEAMDRLAELHAPIIRFPGGFLVERYSNRFDYRLWLPGPIDGLWFEDTKPLETPRRDFGLVEFFDACERLRSQPLIVVPTMPTWQGDWTVEQAAEFAAGVVAFANASTPDDVPERYRGWVQARIDAGRVRPAGVTYWQIGNEIWFEKRRFGRQWAEQAEEQEVEPADINPLADDEAWFDLQLRLVDAVSRAMRAVDPDIQIITDGMLGGGYNQRLAALEPGVDIIADHGYMPWATDGTVRLGNDDGATSVPVEELEPSEHFHLLISMPWLDEQGRSRWRYNRDNDQHDKPMAFTEWNWNGWGDSVNGHPAVRAEWGQAMGAAGFLHAIMRSGDRAVLATQSMMIGNRWDITAIRVGDDHAPFVKPTGRVTGFYSQHHGTDLLAVDDSGVPRFEQPFRLKAIRAHPAVARIDTLATASVRRAYVHLIHRSYDTPTQVTIDLSAVADTAADTAELRMLLGRTDIDLGDPDFAHALVEASVSVALNDGVAEFELPAKAVAVLIVDADPAVIGRQLEAERTQTSTMNQATEPAGND